MKLCRCGAIVKRRCERCSPKQAHAATTAERGYDHRWRTLSERKRREDPLCEECMRLGNVTPATEVHHIVSIAAAPHLRLRWTNLASVCSACHARLEQEARGSGSHEGGGRFLTRNQGTTSRARVCE
jgi:5-methylcytosine-specific restriction enzyme A